MVGIRIDVAAPPGGNGITGGGGGATMTGGRGGTGKGFGAGAQAATVLTVMMAVRLLKPRRMLIPPKYRQPSNRIFVTKESPVRQSA